MTDQVPIERTSFDLGLLAAKVEAAQVSMERDRKALEARTAAADRKAKAGRIAGYVGSVVGVLGLALAGLGYHQLDQFLTQRNANRITACLSDNTNAAKVNGLNDEDQQTLREVFGDSSDPAVLQSLADRLDAYESRKVPLRDCSPSGVKDFYESGGTRGYLP